MAADQTCPSCGETEELSGRRDDDRITITCLACGETWTRGGSRCRTCGGSDVVRRPQPMSRTPRGNQLAIVGWREVLLCLECDADVAQDSISKNTPVPEGYVSRATLGTGATRSTPRPPTAPVKPARATGSPTPRTRREAPPAPAPMGTGAGHRATQPADPTARQAIEAYLTAAGRTADSTAMLMLGTHLGASTRLSQLSRPEAPGALRTWFDRTWAPSSPGREPARAAVLAALQHWAAQQWLSTEVEVQLTAALTD